MEQKVKGHMALTFWEKAHVRWHRDGAKWSRWGPDVYLEMLQNHAVTETAIIRVAESGAPPGAAARIAAEMSSLRARANEVRGRGPMSRMDVQVALSVALLFLLDLFEKIPKLLKNHKEAVGWTREIIDRFPPHVFLLLAVAFYVGVGMMRGQVGLWKRLCFDWADRLEGKAGLDKLDEVVDWLDARWRWFLPPKFGTIDVLWATGRRRGVPVLAVIEQGSASYITKAVAKRVATGHGGGLSPEMWTRTNIFIHGVRFHDAAHRERVQNKANSLCAGIIQCPNGIYLYGAYAFLGMLDAQGPSSEIWLDIVDQIIDWQFHGSATASRKLVNELQRMGLLVAEERLHG